MAIKYSGAASDALHSGATRRAVLKLIPLLALVYFMAYVDRTAVALAKTDLQADVGISAAAFGLGAGLFFVTYALLEVPSNLIMYRIGPRIWIARIAISWGVVTAMTMFVQGEVSFYVLRLLLGATEAGLFPAMLYMVTQWFAHKDRPIVVGYLYLAPAAANVLGSPIGGGIMELDGTLGLQGWQWMFLVLGVVTVAVGTLVLPLLPDKPADARWLSQDEAQILTDRAVGSAPENRLRGNLKKAFGRPFILLVALLYFFNQIAVLGLVYNVPSIIENLGVQGSFQIGLVSGLTGVGAIVGTLLVPRIMARINRPIALIVILSSAAAVLSVMARVVEIPALQIAFLAFVSLCFSGSLPLIWVVAMEHLTGIVAAAGLALINMIGLIGGFVGPYVFGLVEGVTGTPLNGLYLMALACVVGVAISPLLARAVRRERQRKSDEDRMPTEPATANG